MQAINLENQPEPLKKTTVSCHLKGEEGLSEAQFHMSETALRVLHLLVEKHQGFNRKFLLRGGCALYHTVHAHGLFRRDSSVSAVLRWTADVDLEILQGNRDEEVDAMLTLLLEHGFKIRGESTHQKSFATVCSMQLESPEGYETTLDVLDAYRAISLQHADGTPWFTDTSIHWDADAMIPVHTQAIEEIIAKKLSIRFYHQFRPQDALDLFFAFSFMRLDPLKVRAAFLAELSLWASDEQLTSLLNQHTEALEDLFDWLIHFRDQDLINNIFQRVTMENIENLFSNDYHILDKCREVLHGALSSLCRLSKPECLWVEAVQILRRQTLDTVSTLSQLQSRNMRLDISIDRLTMQNALIPVLAEIQDNTTPCSPLRWLNPDYAARCIELYARREMLQCE